MKIARGIAISVMVAGLSAVGFASPASAEDLAGPYALDLGAENSATWTFTPCEDVGIEPFQQCVNVAETGGENAPFEGQAHWQVGYFIMKVDRSDAITCDDGSKLPANVTYSWDPGSLEGVIAFYFPGGCGGAPAGSLSAPFLLTKA